MLEKRRILLAVTSKMIKSKDDLELLASGFARLQQQSVLAFVICNKVAGAAEKVVKNNPPTTIFLLLQHQFQKVARPAKKTSAKNPCSVKEISEKL